MVNRLKSKRLEHVICEICSSCCDKYAVLKASLYNRPMSDNHNEVRICNECLINLINHMKMERSRYLNIDPLSVDKRYFGHTLPHHV